MPLNDKSLNEREYELLETLVAFGGVVTRGMVQKLLPDFSERWAKEILFNLCEKGFIKHIAGFTNPNQKIYQVTFKSCNYFGVGQSHMRKKMSPTILRRNLLKAQFLFNVTNIQQYGAVSSSAKRIKYLNSLGVDNGLIPRKINKGDAVLQIEESFLVQSPFAPIDGICIVLFDKIGSDPYGQLRMMIDRYVPLIRSRIVPLSFLSVAENTRRTDIYSQYYDKHLLNKDLYKPIMNAYSINFTYAYSSDTL